MVDSVADGRSLVPRLAGQDKPGTLREKARGGPNRTLRVATAQDRGAASDIKEKAAGIRACHERLCSATTEHTSISAPTTRSGTPVTRTSAWRTIRAATCFVLLCGSRGPWPGP